MKLIIRNNPVLLFPENDVESVFLKSDYVQSKLNFRIGTETGSASWKINQMKAKIVVDFNKQEINVPFDFTQQKEMCYLLRMLFDGILVRLSLLPLHAAAICNGVKAVIIMAPSGKGKSLVADTMSKRLSSYEIIGDDHVVLFKSVVTGNLKSRQRNPDLSSSYISNYFNDSYFQKLVFVKIQLDDKGKRYCKKKKHNKFLNYAIRREVLKYLITKEPVGTGAASYNVDPLMIFNRAIIKRYRSLLKKTISEAESCWIIKGDKDYIVTELMERCGIGID